jgi:hypothetical protein
MVKQMPNYPNKNKGKGKGKVTGPMPKPVPGEYRTLPVYPQPMPKKPRKLKPDASIQPVRPIRDGYNTPMYPQPMPNKGSKGKGRGNRGR